MRKPSRLRMRGGGSLPWFAQGKADGIDPNYWADFVNNRYAHKPSPLRVATVRNQIYFQRVNATGANRAAIEFTEIIGHDVSDLILSFSSKYLVANTGDTNVGNNWTIENVALVNASRTISVPIFFAGSRSRAMVDGEIDIQSDPIFPSQFGLTKFSRDEKYYIKATFSGATSFFLPAGDNTWANYGNTGDRVVTWFWDSAVTTASSTDATGRFTFTGTPVTWGYNGPKPFVLGNVLGQDNSMLACGDSISSSVDDGATDQVWGAGLFQRATRSASNNDSVPSINLSISSLRTDTLNGSAYAQTFFKYCKDAYIYLGTNDANGGANLATMQSRMTTLYGILNAANIGNIVQHKLLFNTNTTDAYATEANQTPRTAVWNAGGVVEQFNAWLDTKLADNTIDVLLNGTPARGLTNSYVWLPLTTGDGLHPNANGHELLAVPLRTVLRSFRSAINPSIRTQADMISITRPSPATFFDSNGTMQTAGNNIFRFDHDFVTLQPLGFLIEDVRTNSIWNTTNVGVINGVVGSGGSLPTGWGSSLRGLSLSVETVIIRGISCLRMRFFGTPSSSGAVSVPFGAITNAACANGQVWSNSTYLDLQAGNFENVGSVRTQLNVFNSSSSYLTTIASLGSLNSSLTPQLQRFSATGTISNASAAFIQALFEFSVTSGLPVDFTVDMGGCQMEQGAFPTSFIPTSSSAVLRQADQPINNSLNAVPFAEWSNYGVGTVLAEWSMPSSPTGNARVFEMWGSSNESLAITRSSSAVQTVRRTGGVSEFMPAFTLPFTANAVVKGAATFVPNDFTVVANGGTPVTDVTSPMPLTPIRALFGHANGPSGAINGHLRSLRWYPVALPDAELSRITA